MRKQLLYIFAFVFTCLSVTAQTTSQTITTIGNGTFTIPCGVTSIEVEVWGGGGGGGGANTAGYFAGGGSGSGYVKRTITTSGGAVFNYRIGQGGQGGNLSSNGTNGQSSWFSNSSTLLAVGGNGAVNAALIFGTGATAPNTGNIGTTSSYGNNGGWGYNLILIYGTGVGGNGGGSGGAGGSSISGFLTSLNSTNGKNGGQPGGGGSGAYSKNTGDNKLGGNGGNGQIKITYTLPKPTAIAGADFTKTCTTYPSGKLIGYSPITGVTYSWWPTTGLSNATIANPMANPSSTTTYTVTATDACGYTNTDSIVVTVSSTQVAPTIGTITQPTCATATGSVSLSDLPSSGTWTLTPFLNGTAQTELTGTGTSTTVNSLVAGSYFFTIKNSSSCSSGNSSTATVNPQPVTPTAPVINTIFGTSCTNNTGNIELTGLPAGSWTLTPSFGGIAQTTISGAGTSTTVSNLSIGSYTFTVSNGSCISAASASAVVTDNSSTTWNGTAWSNLVPDDTKVAIISGNYDMSTLANIEACSVIINSPAKITVAANKYLTIQNDLTVNSGATLDVQNQGSLVMIHNNGVVTNNGTTTIRKVTTPYERYDYTYWSAPVATTIGGALSTWRQDYSFEFKTANFSDLNGDASDDNLDAWVRVTQATPMLAGKGYAIMAPTTGTFPTTREVVFTGKVNNGSITQNVSLSANLSKNTDDYNLLGNPYPSAISADAFIDANPSTSGTIYLWTHVGNLSTSNPGPGLANYSTDDYAMYNFTGGTGVTAPAGNSATSANTKPTGYIASGQGFFVDVEDETPMVFDNAMRDKSYNNNNFYRVTEEIGTLEKDRIWLNLQNKDGMFSQQLIGYFNDATLGYDKGYDGIVSPTTNYISFYSFIDQAIYRIQGRPAFNENDVVPLGYSSVVSDTFTIGIDTKEGQLNNRSTNIYLEDKLLQVIHDLNQGPYSFTTAKGTFNDRFALRYSNPALEVSDLEALSNEVKVSVNDNQIAIESSKETIKNVSVYDVLGKLILERKEVYSNELNLSSPLISQQTLLITVTLTNGQKVTRKMIF